VLGRGHVGNRAAVIQALREQSGMSTPHARSVVDSLGADRVLSFQKIGEQDRLVAFWTVTAQSYRPAEEVAIRTAALADKTLLTVWTLVDDVARQLALTLQLAAEVKCHLGYATRVWSLWACGRYRHVAVPRPGQLRPGVDCPGRLSGVGQAQNRFS
jgi:hypothetical protein